MTFLEFVIAYWSAWRQYQRHRGHDEDCQYGGRRDPLGDRIRRRLTWRKVSIRPGWAPT